VTAVTHAATAVTAATHATTAAPAKAAAAAAASAASPAVSKRIARDPRACQCQRGNECRNLMQMKRLHLDHLSVRFVSAHLGPTNWNT
jgi:hypothetical protein